VRHLHPALRISPLMVMLRAEDEIDLVIDDG
jgi:hypothetical protein